jgi:arylsulfatase A-like enzyme
MALCCPSRSCILRGQYPHNTQILGNQPPRGGFERFHELGNEESTVGVWLQVAGYRTTLIGKYLNGYPRIVETTYFPPGWDEWYSPLKGAPYRQFKYTLNENGKLVDYGTDVYTNKALDFMGRSIEAGQPFFAFISVYAPHTPTPAAPRQKTLFNDVSVPRSHSF